MKLKFKLIPFLLSLLIVFLVTFGIYMYSYHVNDGNKMTFYEKYFHLEDYKDVESTELLENMVKFQFDEYVKASDTVAIHGENEKIAPSYSNGTIHVPGYFDIDVYITNSISEGESTYSYYFFFYNVNYKESSFNPTEKVQIVVANGSGEGVGEEPEDELYGDALLDQELEKLFDDNEDNNPKYNGLYPYSYGFTPGEDTYNYYVFDNGFTNDPEYKDEPHYVFRSAPRQNSAKEEIFNDDVPEDGTATFAIIINNENKYTELVRGTFSNIDKLSETEFKEGYGADVYKADFSSYVNTKIFIQCSIAFGISAVIAILFYLLWMDPKDAETKKVSASNKDGKKSNKFSKDKKKK